MRYLRSKKLAIFNDVCDNQVQLICRDSADLLEPRVGRDPIESRNTQ